MLFLGSAPRRVKVDSIIGIFLIEVFISKFHENIDHIFATNWF